MFILPDFILLKFICVSILVVQLLELILHVLKRDGLVQQFCLQLLVGCGQPSILLFILLPELISLHQLHGLKLYLLLLQLGQYLPPQTILIQSRKLILLELCLETVIKLFNVLVKSINVLLSLFKHVKSFILLSLNLLFLSLKSSLFVLQLSFYILCFLVVLLPLYSLLLSLLLSLFPLSSIF